MWNESITCYSFVSLYLALLSGVLGIDCPEDFMNVNDRFCVLHLSIPFKYCPAHYACANTGRLYGLRLFMIGRNVQLLDALGLQNEHVFTGLHSFLFDASTSSNMDWQSSDPGYNPVTDNGPVNYRWGPDEPSSRTEQLIEWTSNGLRSSTQFVTSNSVVCELSFVPWPSKSLTELFKRNWPRPISNLILASKTVEGCWYTLKVPTIQMCAFKCHLNDYCRSLYYQAAQKICYLSLYIDSRLPDLVNNTTTGNWIRYARTNW
ncbi:hypothetical protein CSKR_108924 [Clonorchis sinensis]|uniref:Uncharacterized protein n=1 Tax=Clonorchis sinensis TaxID=79923 RepID=A0A419PQI0_CLOSI|nr:hypothetical protein CSKR_108924 [Clonorchis sinensis]